MASAAPPTAVVDAPEEPPSDTSKLKTFIGILRKFMGVADLAAVRFSLPSQLLEPTPNLEYWTYLDAPNAFVAIGTADEPLDRMLEVCRFWFTKDLKYVKGRPCKPYNSCLGEFFRCNWETEDNAPKINTTALKGPTSGNVSSASSIRSVKADKNASTNSLSLTVPKHGLATPDGRPVRISYLTEQTSHHPPVSAYAVSLGGILRGTLSVSVSEMAYITCPKTKLKTILHYIEAGWLGRSTNRVEGIIFRYDPENDNKTTIKDVPEADIVARLGGPWREKIEFTLGPKPIDSHPPEARFTIIDLLPLNVAPKVVPPADKQQEYESLSLWGGVTEAIHAKQFGKATQVKQELEERQREKAREREAAGTTWQPVFFQQVTGNGGQPVLTEKGREVLKRAQQAEWNIDDVVGAAPAAA
ncbi:Oxysterol-binding protein-like protein 1 like [Verticillium longisporum]|uniref:Oxysterol-binding protein-like protein 1 like n=1 Tax=Verticillium longisporum TaxID=100787 RepID=A0A8I3AVJ5_VERLO|nr:Oxysterol-binding protein-like protein 1 like [Verticillium longisporum]